MECGALRALIARDYPWALALDFAEPAATARFWYVSAEKLEPRLGERAAEMGAEREQPLGFARDVFFLAAALPSEGTVAAFLLQHPEWRHVVRHVQIAARHPYAEIRDNLLGAAMRPIDLLRCKLALFGAARFDPRSDRWLRITLFQGAPFPEELAPRRRTRSAVPPDPADLSLNEVATLSAKAARGAGLTWGAAEDTGRSAAWLARHLGAWAEQLLALLEIPPPAAQSPLLLAGPLADGALTEAAHVAAPIWVLPLLLLGPAVAARFQSASAPRKSRPIRANSERSLPASALASLLPATFPSAAPRRASRPSRTRCRHAFAAAWSPCRRSPGWKRSPRSPTCPPPTNRACAAPGRDCSTMNDGETAMAEPAPLIRMRDAGYYSLHTTGAKIAIDKALPLMLDAVRAMDLSGAAPLAVADFGAADGGTSLALHRALLSELRTLAPHRPLTLTHTDLPHNDFSVLFRLLQGLLPDREGLGIPGVFSFASGTSFYQQIFPMPALTGLFRNRDALAEPAPGDDRRRCACRLRLRRRADGVRRPGRRRLGAHPAPSRPRTRAGRPDRVRQFLHRRSGPLSRRDRRTQHARHLRRPLAGAARRGESARTRSPARPSAILRSVGEFRAPFDDAAGPVRRAGLGLEAALRS